MTRPLPPPPPRPPPPPPVKHGSRRGAKKTAVVPATRTAEAVLRAYGVYLRFPDASIAEVWEQTHMVEDDPASDLLRDHVSLRWLQKSAVAGKWKDERDRFWEGVRDRVKARVEDDIVQREVTEINTLARIREVGFEMLVGSEDGTIKPIKAKSWEGAARAVVALDKQIGAKRDRVKGAAGKGAPPQGAPTEMTPDPKQLTGPTYEDGMSQAEVEQLARAMAAGRVNGGPDGRV